MEEKRVELGGLIVRHRFISLTPAQLDLPALKLSGHFSSPVMSAKLL
jgi:hypothetical protein